MSAQEMIYDVIGLGFGVSNLAVAGAFVDKAVSMIVDLYPAYRSLTCLKPSRLPNLLFIERNKGFTWHPGMLLPGVRMQIQYVHSWRLSFSLIRNTQFPQGPCYPEIPTESYHLRVIPALAKPPSQLHQSWQ